MSQDGRVLLAGSRQFVHIQSMRDSLLMSTFSAEPDPDLHLVVDGVRIERDASSDADTASGSPREYVFNIQLPAGKVYVCSRSSSPADVGLGDDRRILGFAVTKLTLSHAGGRVNIPLDGREFDRGFYDIEESGQRWTDGRGEIPESFFYGMTGACQLRIAGDPLSLYLVANPPVDLGSMFSAASADASQTETLATLASRVSGLQKNMIAITHRLSSLEADLSVIAAQLQSGPRTDQAANG